MNPIRILLVDDHRVVLDGIQSMLKDIPDFHLTAMAVDAENALRMLDSHPVDVVVLDINLPGTDGISLCKIIRKRHPAIKILALTTFSEPSIVSSMMRNGASGYLLKNTTADELVEAIKCVHKGEQYLSDEIRRKLISASLGEKKTSSYIPKLTRREKEVLKLILEEHTTNEIADILCISKATVETHRLHLLSKLNVRNTAGLVKVAIQRGLV